MLKQSSSMKRGLAILLVILFVVSLTAIAVNSEPVMVKESNMNMNKMDMNNKDMSKMELSKMDMNKIVSKMDMK